MIFISTPLSFMFCILCHFIIYNISVIIISTLSPYLWTIQYCIPEDTITSLIADWHIFLVTSASARHTQHDLLHTVPAGHWGSPPLPSRLLSPARSLPSPPPFRMASHLPTPPSPSLPLSPPSLRTHLLSPSLPLPLFLPSFPPHLPFQSARFIFFASDLFSCFV